MFNKLLKSSLIKDLYHWKMALLQHPMLLLIDEDRGDPIVGERVLPWGAPDAETYMERVRRNLGSLDKYPDLRLNYEFSAVEVMIVFKRFPDVGERMKELLAEGKLDFVNGSFSQAHLQVLSSESSWRQFEEGARVFKEHLGMAVTVYACQETAHHPQLPQILKHFGYRFMVLPAFPWALELLEGNIELSGYFLGAYSMKDEDFIEAVALDGSSLPVYCKIIDAQMKHLEKGQLIDEISKDLYGGPPIWTFTPDLVEVDQELFEKLAAVYDYSLLGNALSERYKQVQPHAKARIKAYWSYVEGVWAERLLRMDVAAEQQALLLGSLLSAAKMAGVSHDFTHDLEGIWLDILKYQHHDVSWIEVTDLRQKAIDILYECIKRCQNMQRKIGELLVKEDKGYFSVFNGLPYQRRVLLEMEDGDYPAMGGYLQKMGKTYLGFADLSAGGFTCFPIKESMISLPREIDSPRRIMTKYYTVEFSEEGLMGQITLPSGRKLLKAGHYSGGEIKALVQDTWEDNREAVCRFFEGEVAYILERDLKLGHIPIKEKYIFFKDEALIKVEVEFDFRGDEVGYFWIDETKVNIYYPTQGSELYHDIPFGYVKGRENRPLFAINWLYSGGLVYVNRGTVKHWVRDGVIANMIAWGGNSFSNRMHSGWADHTQYDLRLYGMERIEYFLIPYEGFDGNKIVKDVEALTFPVYAQNGKLDRTFFELVRNDLAITSVHEIMGEVRARGYQLPGNPESRYRDFEIFDCPLDDLV